MRADRLDTLACATECQVWARRQYSRWNQVETLMGSPPPYRHRARPPRDSRPWRTVLFAPAVTNTPL